MATISTTSLLHSPRPIFPSKPKPKSKQTFVVSNFPTLTTKPAYFGLIPDPKTMAGLFGAGLALTLVGPTSAAELPLLLQQQQLLSEPANALSLPTWAIHVSSVAEWITAMALVWQYGEKSGFESWKGLCWGMVPLLGGAFCACTWHFFYNSESLEVLVALQAALTVIAFAGIGTQHAGSFPIYNNIKHFDKAMDKANGCIFTV